MSEPADASDAAFWGDADDGEARRRYRSLLDSLGEGVYRLDGERRFVAVNDALVELSGYARADLLGEDVTALFGDDPAAVGDGMERDGTTDGDDELDCTLERADGTELRCVVRADVADDGDGVAETVGVVRRVGDEPRGEATDEHRRDGDREPAVERRRVMQALDTAREGISLLDDGGVFVYVNRAYAETYGYEPAEMIGEHWDDLGIEADPDLFYDEILPDIDAEGQWTGTSTGVRKDGSTFRSRHSLTQTGDGELICAVRDVTEAVERERDLERYETIVETINDGVYVVDENGRFTMVNRAYAEMLGYDREELLGEHVSTVVDDDVMALAQQTEVAMVDGEMEGSMIEAEMKTADGGRLPAEATFAMLPDADGEGRRVGVVRDISERERALRRLEQERDVFAQGPAVVFRWEDEDDWPVEYVSENVADVFGYAAGELESGDVPYTDLLLDEDIDRVTREAEEARDRGTERFSHEPYRIRTADGDVRWVTDTTTIVRDESGEITHYLGYLVDITDRKERERELERKERRFEAVFEDPNILVGLLDPDGTVLDINETALEYIDVDLDAVRGEPFWETPWWGSSDEHGESDGVRADVREWTERAAEGEYVDFEADLTRPDGERYVLEGFFRPVTDDAGDVVSVIVSDRDVTEQREIEEELREHERQLSTLMDNVPGMVYQSQNERGWPMEFVSDACREMTGYEPEALESGEVVWGEDVVVEADRDPLWNAVQAEAEDGGTFSVTYRIETADGEQRWVRDYGRGVFEDGEMVETEGIVSDVTERKRLESELDDVFGRVTDGFFALDENWTFTYVNEHAHDLINPEGRELEGENIWDLYPAATDLEFETQYRRAMDEQVTVSFEEYYPEPIDRWFEAHAYPSETGLSVYFQDVTERKRRERALEESERRYRALAEYFPNGIVTLFDTDLEYTLAAGQGFDRIAVDPSDVEGTPVTEVWDEATADALEPLFEAALDGEERSVDLSYAGREWVVHAAPVTDDDGDVFAGMTMAQDITERKERERELRKYETIVETMNDGIYVKDENGYFTMVNEAYAELTGYDREELLGEHASIVVDESAIEQSREIQTGVTDEDAGKPAMEATLRTADGGEVPTEGTFSTLETDDGERNEVGVVRDITERKAQRRKIEESERRYRTLVENFPNGAVGMFDENLEYTVVGGDILDDVGTSAEEVVGQTVWDRYPDGLAAQLEPNFRAAIEDGETSEFEMEFHDRHWMAYTVPIRDSEGDVFAGMIMVQDVTERIRREQALEESKNQLQALIELLPVAVFVAEADGEIVEWNEAAEELWGGEVVESDSVAEYDQYDGWWADTGEPVEPDEWALARALEGEEVTDPDVIEIEGFDGERRTVLNHGMPVRDADGEVARAVVTLTDITERNEYQRKLEASNERLEQFAYAASHDLQEPLRMVSSYLRLIEQRYADELDEDGEEFIEYAVDGADRMRNMIEGLLQYSRVDTRGDPFEPVDLAPLLADVREDLQVTLDESDAEITVGELPRVEGDDGQLRQVFQNLLENAVEYSGDEPPRIEIDAERAGDEWRVSVSDDGIGIEADDADRVFEVFQSLHAPDDHSGTGIGLALCERIVERHGGDIWVDSEPGEGSTFTFTLPVAGEADE